MVMEMYSVTGEQMQINASIMFTKVIHDLVAFGEIDSAKGECILDSYIIVMHKKSWFGRALDRVCGNEPNKVYFALAKVTR